MWKVCDGPGTLENTIEWRDIVDRPTKPKMHLPPQGKGIKAVHSAPGSRLLYRATPRKQAALQDDATLPMVRNVHGARVVANSNLLCLDAGRWPVGLHLNTGVQWVGIRRGCSVDSDEQARDECLR